MHAKNVHGRMILIVDEVGPGAYAHDISSDLHPAKMAMIMLRLFKQYSSMVEDEMARKEIFKQFEFIANIVTGKKDSSLDGGVGDIEPPTIPDPPKPPSPGETNR